MRSNRNKAIQSIVITIQAVLIVVLLIGLFVSTRGKPPIVYYPLLWLILALYPLAAYLFEFSPVKTEHQSSVFETLDDSARKSIRRGKFALMVMGFASLAAALYVNDSHIMLRMPPWIHHAHPDAVFYLPSCSGFYLQLMWTFATVQVVMFVLGLPILKLAVGKKNAKAWYEFHGKNPRLEIGMLVVFILLFAAIGATQSKYALVTRQGIETKRSWGAVSKSYTWKDIRSLSIINSRYTITFEDGNTWKCGRVRDRQMGTNSAFTYIQDHSGKDIQLGYTWP